MGLFKKIFLLALIVNIATPMVANQSDDEDKDDKKELVKELSEELDELRKEIKELYEEIDELKSVKQDSVPQKPKEKKGQVYAGRRV